VTSTEEVTRLLVHWGNGDQAALDELIQVYDELRREMGNSYTTIRRRPISYIRRRIGRTWTSCWWRTSAEDPGSAGILLASSIGEHRRQAGCQRSQARLHSCIACQSLSVTIPTSHSSPGETDLIRNAAPASLR
jgi:hypothetical protein